MRYHSGQNVVDSRGDILNTLLTRRQSRLYSRLKKRTRCHSFTALNRASDVSAAD